MYQSPLQRSHPLWLMHQGFASICECWSGSTDLAVRTSCDANPILFRAACEPLFAGSEVNGGIDLFTETVSSHDVLPKSSPCTCEML